MKTTILRTLIALGLTASSAASFGQTILNATFEADRLGEVPTRHLPGPPELDELLYWGAGEDARVAPFPAVRGRRALRLSPSAGSAFGLVELVSAPLPPGERARVRGGFIGMMPGKGRLIVTLSRDSHASLFALELSDGEVILHVLESDGTTRERIRFARYTIGRAHGIGLEIDVRTGKSRISFEEAGRGVIRSPAFASAGAKAIGNARTLSYVVDYAPRQTPKGEYLLDGADLWLAR